jgi:hypothetical protein
MAKPLWNEPEPPPAPPPDPAPPPEPAPPPAAKKAAATSPAPAPTHSRRWKVLEEVRVSVGGHVSTFAKGKIVNEAHYVPDIIERLQNAGAKLEELR